MIKISVVVKKKKWLNYIKDPQISLEKKLKILSKKSNFLKKKKLELSLLLSGKREIKILNKKFRKKDKSTDVLSFPFYEKVELKKLMTKKKNIYLGDIIINLDKVAGKPKSKNFMNNFDKLWIHGFVHLFGYQNKKNKDFLKMVKLEKIFFNTIN